jgi:CTP:molybdopterin cytidylyltransferase MocA
VIGLVVLAGGAGSRFGGPKQLHPIRGRPMLEHVLAAVAAVAAADRVLVLGAHAEQVLAGIDLQGVRAIRCDRWAEGQALTLRAGLDSLPAGVMAAIVVLGDGPSLDPRAIERMAAAHAATPASVLYADYGEGRSHPVVLPRVSWDALASVGERPAAAVPAEAVDCRDLTDPGDIDRPGDAAGLF